MCVLFWYVLTFNIRAGIAWNWISDFPEHDQIALRRTFEKLADEGAAWIETEEKPYVLAELGCGYLSVVQYNGEDGLFALHVGDRNAAVGKWATFGVYNSDFAISKSDLADSIMEFVYYS